MVWEYGVGSGIILRSKSPPGVCVDTGRRADGFPGSVVLS